MKKVVGIDRVDWEAAMEQEQRSLMLTGDFFKRIIITKDTPARKLKDAGYDTLFGHRVFVSNYMSESVPASKPVLFGDFSYFWIGDRGKRNIKH
ncbi:MAG: phage major capsid protein [Blautia sp.]|nr:phage major capsid protein [Blautia sp.]MDY5665149.1 phage major capsid protein [Blautia sp.]